MAEPDFDQIARDLVDAYDPDAMADRSIAVDIVEQLRQVWNARGAADAQAVEHRLRELVAGEVIGAGIARHIIDAIRIADR